MTIALLRTSVALARVTSPAPRDVWAAVAAADSSSLAEHTPAWMDALVGTTAWKDVSRCYEFSDGRRFVLPLARHRWRPAAALCSFPPAWGIGGLVGPDRDADVLKLVLEDLGRLRVASVRIRPNPLDADAWRAVLPSSAVTVQRRAHVLHLRGGIDEVWNRMSQSTRRHIRQGEKAGLEITTEATLRTLGGYYGLYERSLERWAHANHEPQWLARFRGRRRDPLTALQRSATELGEAFRLWMAWKDGVPVAGIIVRVGNTAHYTRGAMDIDLARPLHASHLLHWIAIQAIVEQGIEVHHLGDSGTSSSLAQFKEGLGADPVDYDEVRLERIPLTAADRLVRKTAKRVIGFRDAT